MAGTFNYHFEWNPAKAASNRRKHGVTFEQAATVFLDPLMVSAANQEHSEHEERWLTLGYGRDIGLLVVIHTYQDIDIDVARVRIISARPATKHEQRQYGENR
ncbi:MAG: BrnT family toxin [Candidatus Competibacteraceae bacterium]|nr:BrnT family toxin [Candidatus Competibacteraceae bacterium]